MGVFVTAIRRNEEHRTVNENSSYTGMLRYRKITKFRMQYFSADQANYNTMNVERHLKIEARGDVMSWNPFIIPICNISDKWIFQMMKNYVQCYQCQRVQPVRENI